MSAATAQALMQWDGCRISEFESLMISNMQSLGRTHPGFGYGARFLRWIYSENPAPYNSWGNGSAMRVSPVGFYADSLNGALELAAASARVTHNHPAGIAGAQAAAACVYIARTGGSKNDVKSFVQNNFYDMNFTLESIRRDYTFDVSCPGSVPQAIEAFLEGTDFEDVIRLAISIGGDSDTIACIAGGIAQAYYGVPESIKNTVLQILHGDEIELIVRSFQDRFYCENKTM
jgi:type I restriction enzyme M protein